MEAALHTRIQPDGDIPDHRPGSWWLPATLRAIVLGQLILVSFVAPLPDLAAPALVLALIGSVATIAELREPPLTLAFFGEAVAAGCAVALSPEPSYLLAYLILPGFAAGLRLGSRCALGVVAAALGGVLLPAVARGLADELELLGPLVVWLAAAVAMAILGSLARRRLTPQEGAAYADAARLLQQFQELTPRLSGGLDTTTIATSLLDDLEVKFPHDRSAVIADGRAGTAAVLASRLAPPEWLDEIVLAVMMNPTSPAVPGRTWVHRDGAASPFTLVVDPMGEPSRSEQDAAATLLRLYVPRLQAALTFQRIWQSATLEERQRLSREIHDGIAQDLASLAYSADEAVESACDDDDRARLSQLRDSLRAVLAELRISIFDLRAVEAGQPLAAAVSDLARRTAEACGLDLEVRLNGQGVVPREIERELTRIAQEALSNVRKHARAARLKVDIEQDGSKVRIRIADDGQGIAWRETPALSAGVSGMKERAAAVGAQLRIESEVGAGTVVDIEYGGPDVHHAHTVDGAARRRPRAHP